MSQNDPIADMITAIRNAHAVRKTQVVVPHSKMKSEIARLLKQEGFIADYGVEGAARKELRMKLKYSEGNEPVIRGIRRASTGGLRRYARATEVPRVLQGMGAAIVSTSSGIMTGREARRRKIGGEVVLTVW